MATQRRAGGGKATEGALAGHPVGGLLRGAVMGKTAGETAGAGASRGVVPAGGGDECGGVGGEWAERSFGGIGEEAGCRVSGRGERCGRVAGGRCGCSGGRRRGAGEGGGLDGSGVAGEGGFGVNRGVAERAGSRRRQKMGVEVQFGGGAEYGFCRNFVNLFGNALR